MLFCSPMNVRKTKSDKYSGVLLKRRNNAMTIALATLGLAFNQVPIDS